MLTKFETKSARVKGKFIFIVSERVKNRGRLVASVRRAVVGGTWQ